LRAGSALSRCKSSSRHNTAAATESGRAGLGADLGQRRFAHFAEQTPFLGGTPVRTAVPDKQGTVAVYCADAKCQASSKAARRMDELGYRHVLDYEAGKSDWQKAGLPVET